MRYVYHVQEVIWFSTAASTEVRTEQTPFFFCSLDIERYAAVPVSYVDSTYQYLFVHARDPSQ